MRGECGLFRMVDYGSDRLSLEVATTQCCHCHRHFVLPKFEAVFVRGMLKLIGYDWSEEAKASRAGRAWCPNHGKNGYVCGPGCLECVDREKKLEIAEGRRSPTAVSNFQKGRLWLPPIYNKG